MKGTRYMSNLNQNRRRKATFGTAVMRVAGVLLALTALTVWATSFMFARYTTRTGFDSDGRVAKFNVGMNMETSEELLIDVALGGENGQYVVTLTNNSETAVRSDLELDFTEINTTYKDSNNNYTPVITKITARVDKTPEDPQSTAAPDTIIAAKDYTVTDNKVLIPGVKDLAPGANFSVIINMGTEEGLSAEAIKAITASMTGLNSADADDPAEGDVELPFYVKAIFTQID